MAVRALIIAIEDYPQILDSVGLALSLIGTNDFGERFLKWLVDIKKVPRANIHYCGKGRGSAGTNRPDIIKEIVKLVHEGRDQTEELYVLFSGHGFAYKEGLQRPTDILIASDFIDNANSGSACLKLDEVQEKLRMAMGPGHHYYFLDACRNQITEGEVDPTDMGVVFP